MATFHNGLLGNLTPFPSLPLSKGGEEVTPQAAGVGWDPFDAFYNS